MVSAKTSPRGPRRAQLLALATGAGLAAALLAYFGLARQTQGAAAMQEERPMAVVVAAHDIAARQPLTMSLLRVQRLPASQVPTGSVANPGELSGQVTTAEVAQGQPVTRGMVTPRTASPGLAWSVAPARRAVSVALDSESGVNGFLEPGDHVDVLATFEAGDRQAVTRTIIQNARLLSIGGRTTPLAPDAGTDEKPATGAALEVTPCEAQALALASARAKLQLSLRGLDDATQLPVPALPSAAVTGAASFPGDAGAWHAKPVQGAPPVQAVKLVPAKTPTVKPRPAPPKLGDVGSPTPAPLPHITVIRGTETTTVTVGE